MRVLVFVLAIGLGSGHLGAQDESYLGKVTEVAPPLGQDNEIDLDIYANTPITTQEGEAYKIDFDHKVYFLGGDTVVTFVSPTHIRITQGLVCLLYDPPNRGDAILVSTPLGRLCVYGSIVWVEHDVLDQRSTFAAQLVAVDAEVNSVSSLPCSVAGAEIDSLATGQCRILDSVEGPLECPEMPLNNLGNWAHWTYPIHFTALKEGLPDYLAAYNDEDRMIEIAKEHGNWAPERFTRLFGNPLGDPAVALIDPFPRSLGNPTLLSLVAQAITKGKKDGK